MYSFYLLAGLSLLYSMLLAAIAYSWKRLPRPPLRTLVYPFISIVIAARNEAHTLPALLDSLQRQAYPSDCFEVLIINDHSTDQTEKVMASYRLPSFRMITLPAAQKGKKAALACGIAQSQGTFLLTTDADCQLPPDWLKTMSSYLQREADLVLAPVRIRGADTFLTAFQGLDVTGTMLLTGAAVQLGYPALANGANLGFRADLLRLLGGYAPRLERSSGDDIFFLHAAAKSGARITYCQSEQALVDTEAVSSWGALLQQRLRWAGKTSSYRHWGLLGFQGFVFLYSWGLLVVPVLAAGYWRWGLVCWGIKLLSDGLFLRYACRQVGRQQWLRWLLPASILHTLYVAVVGALALLPLSGKWKGRRVQ